MATALAQIAQPLNFSLIEQMVVANGAIARLLLASGLGGLIGIEREIKRKSAGLRTNMLLCVGSAFFTLLSPILAGDLGNNKGQIASNIVQGIGFLGAGLILHNRARVSGLASAASIWVVASVGMACGAGQYAAACVGALIVILALEAVGLIEQNVNLKSYPVTYEARGYDQTRMMESILAAMDDAGQRLADVESDSIGALHRVSFPLATTKRLHQRLHADLSARPEIEKLISFRDVEDD